MKLLTYLDLATNELRNAVVQNLASAPSSPKIGQAYFNTSSNVFFAWNGAAWRPADAAALTDGSIAIAALAVNPLNRANHTGTQTAATISDLSTTVKGYTLDTFAAPNATVNFNSQRLTGLATASASSDAVPFSQMQTAITAAIAGQTSIKSPARFASATNINIASPGTTIDGVTPTNGDRILLFGQTTASQNGLYIYNGSGSALTLSSDANSTSQWLEGTEILVSEGNTYTGAIFSQSTANPTVTTLTFVQRNKINAYLAGNGLGLSGFTFSVTPVSGGGILVGSTGVSVDTTVVARKVTATITGDGSKTSFAVTHNLNTQTPIVQVQDSSNNVVLPDVVMSSTSAIAVNFGAAPAANVTYQIAVVG